MNINESNNFPWGHQRPYNDLGNYFRQKFGSRVQKLSVNGGFTCPNRDGTLGFGGCSFCNNEGFNPYYCSEEKSVTKQLEQGKVFFSNKYPGHSFLAYFQSYTSTYKPVEELKQLYKEALSVPGIIGLVIGTRPDCIEDSLLSFLEDLAKRHYICIEYGVESTNNGTLDRINRGHSWEQSVDAIVKTSKRGIHIGAHMIIGLPGEDHSDFMNHIARINLLPLDLIKFHQLQIIKGTLLAEEYLQSPGKFRLFSIEDYIDQIVSILEMLKPTIIVERFVTETSKDLLLAPKWGLKNFEIVDRLIAQMKIKNTWQGRLVYA